MERLGAVAVASRELLHLRADRAVLQDEGDLPRQGRERPDGGARLEGRKRALQDEEARVELVRREPRDQLVARPGGEAYFAPVARACPDDLGGRVEGLVEAAAPDPLADLRPPRRGRSLQVNLHVLAGVLDPLGEGHGFDGQQAAERFEGAPVPIRARAEGKDVGDLAHDVELAVLPRDPGVFLLHRRETLEDEGGEHDGEEGQEQAHDAVVGVDQDLEHDDRNEQEQGDELEEAHSQEAFGRDQPPELQVREDEQRVHEEEDEQGGRGRDGGGEGAGGGVVQGTEEDRGDAVREGELREVEGRRERQAAGAPQELRQHVARQADEHRRAG